MLSKQCLDPGFWASPEFMIINQRCLNFIYGTDLTGDLLAYFGYNHIRARYRDERAIDNEISFDMVYKLF